MQEESSGRWGVDSRSSAHPSDQQREEAEGSGAGDRTQLMPTQRPASFLLPLTPTVTGRVTGRCIEQCHPEGLWAETLHCRLLLLKTPFYMLEQASSRLGGKLRTPHPRALAGAPARLACVFSGWREPVCLTSPHASPKPGSEWKHYHNLITFHKRSLRNPTPWPECQLQTEPGVSGSCAPQGQGDSLGSCTPFNEVSK